jgi:oxygen-independent coproporphyrinogen-3 oxidase
MGEMMMLGLRLSEGVGAAAFRARFGRDLEQVYGRPLEELAAAGLIQWDGQRARLTARGRLLGNRVFARFLP